MLLNIVIAAVLMVATTGIHTGGMILALHAVQRQRGDLRQRLRRTHIYWISVIVLLMFLVSLVEVLVWASTYLALDAIQGFEQALYFSMVTFTTLGYGDVVLEESWRLLASFEAANGIIMFGWTTAIIITAVQRIYFSKESGPHRQEDSGNTQRSGLEK
jgi:hypothetical protein